MTMPTEPPEPEKLPESERKKGFNDYKDRFFSSDARDFVSYILLTFGIILLFFHPLYGGLLIGVVVGSYFSPEIVKFLKNVELVIEDQGVSRSLILAGLLLAFIISIPTIFIGIALVIAIKLFIADKPSG